MKSIAVNAQPPIKFLCQKIRGDRSLYYSISVHHKQLKDENQDTLVFCISEGFELPGSHKQSNNHLTLDKIKEYEEDKLEFEVL